MIRPIHHLTRRYVARGRHTGFHFPTLLLGLCLGVIAFGVAHGCMPESTFRPSPPLLEEENTLQVGPGCTYQTIGEAIDYANAQYGYHDTITIRVAKKTTPYDEAISIHNASQEKDWPRLIIEGPDSDNWQDWPTIRGAPDTGGEVVGMTGGALRHFVVRRYPDPTGSSISRKGIAVFSGVSLVESCRIEAFNRFDANGYPEKAVLVFCATNHGQANPSTVWNCDIVNNGVGIEFGETLAICAWNRIRNNVTVGVAAGYGGVSQIFSNVIEGNGGPGITLYNSGGWLWTNYSEVCNNTICNNEGNGIDIEHTDPSDDMPVAAVIRDNDIYENDGYGIYCDSPEGCWPHLRSNNVWSNGRGEYSARCPFPIDSISNNPERDGDWYLTADSAGIDAGSLTLEAGATVQEPGGALVLDTAVLDLGYHHAVESDDADAGLPQACLVCAPSDASDDCTSYAIQDGVDASQPGDVIRVRKYATPYRESVIVPETKADLVITSELAGEENRPTIVGDGECTIALFGNAILRNFAITRDAESQGGIGVSVSGSGQVDKCEISNHDVGVEASCQYGSGEGLCCPLISHNVVSNNVSHGIHLVDGSSAKVFSNWIDRNGFCGIRLESSPTHLGFAEISSNTIRRNGLAGGDGVFLNYVQGDFPLCPYIRDNVVYENYGYGYHCSQPYGLWSKPSAGGCYPNMRYNNVWFNSYTDSIVSPTHQTDPQSNYLNCPTCLGDGDFGCHGRMMNPMSFDPEYNGMFLTNGSQCIDAGSLTLEPGVNHWEGASTWPDRDQLDLGYHHPPAVCPWIAE